MPRAPGEPQGIMGGLARLGVLRLDAIVVVVGAGSDRLVFDLTEHVGTVVAVDGYRDGADVRMLTDLAGCATPTWVRRRLVVRDGSASTTGLGDGTADAVVLVRPQDATPDAIDEAARVLRPGGTTLLVAGAPDAAEAALGRAKVRGLVEPPDAPGDGVLALVRPGAAPGRRHRPAPDPEPEHEGRPVLGVRDDVVSLTAYLPDRLVVVDAGCRWGFGTHWETYGAAVTVLGFDPDADECARLAERYATQHPELDARLAAVALGAREGTAELERFAERSHDSLLPHDVAALEHLELGGEEPVVDRVTVPVTTVDAWTATHGVGRVDVVKLDVEGYELEVLRGAVDRLADVRLVESEVRFNPILAGGPLLGEVDAFLRERGFVLWRLRDLVHYELAGVAEAPDVVEVNSYGLGGERELVAGSGPLTWGTGIWVRRDMVDRVARLGWECRLRDAAIANALRLHDLTLHALDRLLDERPPPGLAAAARAVLAARP